MTRRKRNGWWYGVGGGAVLVTAIALIVGERQRQPHSPTPDTLPRVAGSEICGFGRAPSETSSPVSLDGYVGKLTDKTTERWRVALLESSDPRARALGLQIRRFKSWSHHQEGTGDADATEAEDARDELVQMAVGGSDPAVYLAAIQLCETGLKDAATTSSCQRVSLAGWSRIDPENLMPWLALARDARNRSDPAGEAAAFAQAAQARRSDLYDDAMLQAALMQAPPDAKPLERAVFSIDVIGYLSALPRLQLGEALRYCSREALQQDQKRRQCNAVAEVLVNKGKTLFDLSIASRLGEQLDWAPQRVAQLKQEIEVGLHPPNSDANPWSCQSVALTNKMTTGWAQSGELQFWRDYLAHSNPTVAAGSEAP